MTEITKAKNYDNKKVDLFYCRADFLLAFALTINLVREVKNSPPNFKRKT